MHTRHLSPTAILLTLLIAASPVFAQQFDITRPDPASILFKDGEASIRARFQYFKDMRVFPGTEIPDGAQERAWEQSQSMNVWQPASALSKAAGSAAMTWSLVGPVNAGGRVTGVAIHPTNPDIVYFTAASGGVWKSTNAGADFVPIAENLATMAMGAIEVSVHNPDHIWVGTGEANGSADSYPGIGIVRSTDAGATWSAPMCTAAKNIAKLRVHLANPDIILCASRQGLYRSTNNGSSWISVMSGLIFDLVLHPTSHNIMYAAKQTAGIFKSTDHGATWTQLPIGVPSDSVGRVAMDLCRSQPSILYAAIVSGKGTSNLKAVVKSTNDGASWTRINNASTPNFYSTYGWYLNELAVDPQNPNHVTIGGVSIYRSVNGGATWSTISGLHVDHHAHEYSLSNPTICYEGNDGGIYRSTNSGQTYTSLNANLPITQFYEMGLSTLDPTRMGGGTQDNGSWDRKTGASTWAKSTGGDGFYVVFDPTNANYIYTESQNGYHYRSTNGGASYSGINTGLYGSGLWNTPVAIHPTTPTVLFTATTKQLYKTTNRGTLWVPYHGNMDSASSINYIAINPRNGNHMFVGYRNGRIWRSTNGGASWTNSQSGLPTRVCMDIQPHPTNDSIWFASYSGYSTPNIFKTTNGGATWSGISASLAALPVSAIEVNPWDPDMIFAGTDLGVYVTTNGGSTWNIVSQGMPKVVVADLELQRATGTLYAATHGRSVFSLDVMVPVQFTSFAAERDGAHARLSWRTAWEVNSMGFAVERREQRAGTEGAWQEIGYVPSTGSPQGGEHYSWRDTQLPRDAAAVTYRLRQIDADGTIDYSPEVRLMLDDAAPTFLTLEQNYPNPFNPSTVIRWQHPETQQVRLVVTDLGGREVAVLVDGVRGAGEHAEVFDAQGLPAGTYFYHLTTPGARRTRSMTILK
jgi:photosystem II stability/assembly factor-like uncharacterized protein